MAWLALLAGAALVLLLVPFTITFHVKGTNAFELETAMLWGCLALGGEEKARTPRRTGRHRRAAVRRLPSLSQIGAVLGSDDFLRSLVGVGRRLLRALAPKDLRLWVRFGLGDPAATAWLWSACSLARASGHFGAGSRIEVDADFGEAGLEIDGGGTVRIVPLAILAIVLAYLLTPAPWRAFLRFARA